LRTLFLTWDGPQQSYLESLFFPIFAALRAQGVAVDVLQLTWASPEQLAPVRAAAAAKGIGYASRSVPVSLRKLALPAVIGYGASAALLHMRQNDIGTLFPRSLIPMAMALTARRLRPGLDLMFDADGFMADERLDFGGWRATSLQYRALRRVERAGVERARAVLCRTRKAREILVERAGGDAQLSSKIFVAPNAKSGDEFTPGSAEARRALRAELGVPEPAPWVVYVGSLGPQYCPEQMFATFAEILRRRPDARLGCFTFHRDVAERAAERAGLSRASVAIGPLPPARVPQVLAAADLGLALRRESPSQRGICPIKVGEYLLCGTPLVSTGVGDLREQLAESGAAKLVDVDAPELAASIADWFVGQVLPERERLRGEARNLGLRWFELGDCVRTYLAAMRHPAAVPRDS
jgi:glycosyltransferase involved in cell wall biosynthesis